MQKLITILDVQTGSWSAQIFGVCARTDFEGNFNRICVYLYCDCLGACGPAGPVEVIEAIAFTVYDNDVEGRCDHDSAGPVFEIDDRVDFPLNCYRWG